MSIERSSWLGIVHVALDAMRMRDYERAWQLYAELDALHPTWIFELKRSPLRGDVGKPETAPLKVIAWMLREQGWTYKQIGNFVGRSAQRASELHRGGARIVAATGVVLGNIEDDFLAADLRREKRRLEHEAEK